MVLGAHHCAWMVLLGACHFSWVEVLGARHIVRGWWWWCALVSPFLGGGGGGAPSWVFMRRVVLLPFEGEGGGWLFVFAGTPSIVVIVGIVSVCCRRVSSLSRVLGIACPRRHCVFSLCHCLMPSSSLSRVAVVAVPSL